MLDRVEATNAQGTTLTLPLYEADEGYSIQDIDGLDPVQANIVTSSFALMDGEQYHSSRRVSRDLNIRLGLDPSYGAASVQQLRTNLYWFFMPKSEVRLRFYFDDEKDPKEIYARVESFDSPRFVKDPTATISMIAVKPDFYLAEPTILEGRTVEDFTTMDINYEGTVETGVVFTLMPNRPLNQFSIFQQTPNQQLVSLDFSSSGLVGASLTATSLVAGDELTISTVTGDKYVQLKRENAVRSILYAVSSYSNWINLFPGTNRIRVSAGGTPIPYTLEYTTKFGGI